MNLITLQEAIDAAKRNKCCLAGKGNGMIKLYGDQGPESSNGQELGSIYLNLTPDHTETSQACINHTCSPTFAWEDLGIEEVRDDTT